MDVSSYELAGPPSGDSVPVVMMSSADDVSAEAGPLVEGAYADSVGSCAETLDSADDPAE